MLVFCPMRISSQMTVRGTHPTWPTQVQIHGSWKIYSSTDLWWFSCWSIWIFRFFSSFCAPSMKIRFYFGCFDWFIHFGLSALETMTSISGHIHHLTWIISLLLILGMIYWPIRWLIFLLSRLWPLDLKFIPLLLIMSLIWVCLTLWGHTILTRSLLHVIVVLRLKHSE